MKVLEKIVQRDGVDHFQITYDPDEVRVGAGTITVEQHDWGAPEGFGMRLEVACLGLPEGCDVEKVAGRLVDAVIAVLDDD